MTESLTIEIKGHESLEPFKSLMHRTVEVKTHFSWNKDNDKTRALLGVLSFVIAHDSGLTLVIGGQTLRLAIEEQLFIAPLD